MPLYDNRKFSKYFFLGLITAGLYDMVVMSQLTEDLNAAAGRYDKKHTMNSAMVSVFTPLTLGIANMVWNHRFAQRLGDEQERRGIQRSISSKTWWGWGFFGSCILVGPFIYAYKTLKAMNTIAKDYNEKGC